MKGKDLIKEGDIIAVGFDDCIIGVADVVIRDQAVRKVIYSVNSMVRQLAEEFKADAVAVPGVDVSQINFDEEAMEYLEFNTFGAFVGDGTPIFLYDDLESYQEEKPHEQSKEITH